MFAIQVSNLFHTLLLLLLTYTLGRTTMKGLRSWWPLVRSFEHHTAGDNFGRWTRRLEEDYQGRLRRIEAGTHTPMTSRQWKNDLKGQKMARDLRANYQKAAREIIRR